jgi:hypothetical protein
MRGGYLSFPYGGWVVWNWSAGAVPVPGPGRGTKPGTRPNDSLDRAGKAAQRANRPVACQTPDRLHRERARRRVMIVTMSSREDIAGLLDRRAGCARSRIPSPVTRTSPRTSPRTRGSRRSSGRRTPAGRCAGGSRPYCATLERPRPRGARREETRARRRAPRSARPGRRARRARVDPTHAGRRRARARRALPLDGAAALLRGAPAARDRAPHAHDDRHGQQPPDARAREAARAPVARGGSADWLRVLVPLLRKPAAAPASPSESP